VLNPFSKTPIPDPDFTGPGYSDYDGGQTGQPFYKEAPRGLVGLAGESRVGDSNSPMYHVQLNSGPQNLVYQNEGTTFIAQTGNVPEGTRPAKNDKRPSFFPGTPCELQEPPNLHAAGGPADKTYLADRSPVPIPPLPLPQKNAGITGFGPQKPSSPTAAQPQAPRLQSRERHDQIVVNEIKSYLKLQAEGARIPSPLSYEPKLYIKVLDDFGYTIDSDGPDAGTIVKKQGGAKRSVR
jgi:hypothetical protein